MGYHVRILRTVNGQADPITKSELESLAALLPGSRLEPNELNRDILDFVSAQGGEDVARLVFHDGELWTKAPNDNELRLMLDIATRLGARVRGDELETYRSPNDWYIHPDDEAAARTAGEVSKHSRQRARWMPWIFRGAGILIVIFCGYVVSRFR